MYVRRRKNVEGMKLNITHTRDNNLFIGFKKLACNRHAKLSIDLEQYLKFTFMSRQMYVRSRTDEFPQLRTYKEHSKLINSTDS